MKYSLLIIFLFVFEGISFAQNKSDLWKNTIKQNNMVALDSRMQLPENKLFKLNLVGLKSNLKNTPSRTLSKKQSVIELSIPNANGVLEKFSIYENSIMEPALAARYPEIKSYIGIGIDNPLATAYFSVSPLGFKSMTLSPDKSAVFIEPISADLETYTVYTKADKELSLTPFECSVIEEVKPQIEEVLLRPNADDALFRTFRLAMSCTGEFTTYFGGTKALALAAINNSITRCNGVFERDFGATLIIIANTDLVIYTNASTDPYAPTTSSSNWNSQLQSTLTSVIGESNYDIGHLFAYGIGGGNAGCIGCVCVNNSKGSAYTSTSGPPSGDTFDIDYVAHEIGHQMGANHTFSHSNEGTGANMEPGSGSTIMGYAGITNQDVQPNSDAYFHAISIQQVTDNIKAKSCSVNTVTGNAIPTANAGLDYIIPKSTPFVLTGSGTDANGDTLTYNWEQFDNAAASATGAISVASATRTTGPTFRSYNSSTSPLRYFPRMTSVLAGATTTAGTEINVEALPSVARTLNFRLTVRDNRPGGPANNSDDMVVTVDAVAGPFIVTSPNTAISYAIGTTQNVTWDTAGTTANGVNCANVDILISANGGSTWSTLVSETPNDGNQAITLPSTTGTTYRIMVKGTNHIFFDVSNTNFSIINAPAAPTISSISATSVCSGNTFTVTGTNLSTTNAVSIGGIPVASYVINSNTQITLTAGNGTTGTVSVTTAGGSVTSSTSITINPLPTTSWAASTNTSCQSTSARTATLAYTATTNTPTTYSITWSASPTNSFTPVTNQSFSGTVGGGTITITIPANTNAGTYTGTITVRNVNGCISAATQTFTVTINPCGSQTIVSTTPQNKKVILEEFTGINCQYCPSGHAIANTIKNANPADVFLINIHVGSFATPGAGQPDFRTSFGTAINNQAGVIGYPAATVNRTAFTGLSQNGTTGTAMNRSNWTNAANQTRNQSSYVNVATTATIDVNTRLLTVFVEAYYTGASPVASNRLNVALLQNNTLGPQTSGGLGDNYPHQHRLVHMLTGQWGDSYNTTTAGTLITRTYTYTIPAAYNSIPAELGNFEIVAFVAEGQQKIISGNGTVPTYTGLNANDAKIKEVMEIAEQCVNSLQPIVEIQNNGQSNLTSLPITYDINGGTPQVFNWTGNLASLAKTTITLPSITYSLQANNNLNVSIPADDNATNNSGVVTFVKAPETTTSNLTIKITLDQYGSETSWTLKNSAGATVASSPAYVDAAAAGEYPQPDINITVPNDCYTFTILDSYGDGIVGDYGFGSYSIFSSGVVISGVEGGEFRLTDTRSFSVANPLNTSESVVNVKMNIQGYYDTTTHEMRPVLANQGVGSSSTNVDNVTVELHEDAAPYAIVASTTAMLQRNGSIRATFFPSAVGRFYIVVKHRNSLETWSATAQTVDATELTYDFTDSASKAFGSNMILIDGKYAIYNGDINQDGFIESGDYPSLYNDSDAGFEGFFTTDLNGDGFVESADYPILFNNSDSGIESIHP